MTDSRSLTPSPIPSLKGRAFTDSEKRDAIEAILAAWVQSKHLRLGQLIVCALTPVAFTRLQVEPVSTQATNLRLMVEQITFYIEDAALVDACSEFSAKVSGR